MPSVRRRGATVLRDQAALRRPSASTSTPMRSLSFMIRYSTPSSLTSVPDHFPKSTRSPSLTSMGMSLPDSSRPPGPTAMTSPCEGFSLAVSGMMMPPADFSLALMRDARVPKKKTVHVIVDNYAAHKHPKVLEWIDKHPRVVFHFTPTSASWLNAVEGFF